MFLLTNVFKEAKNTFRIYCSKIRKYIYRKFATGSFRTDVLSNASPLSGVSSYDSEDCKNCTTKILRMFPVSESGYSIGRQRSKCIYHRRSVPVVFCGGKTCQPITIQHKMTSHVSTSSACTFCLSKLLVTVYSDFMADSCFCNYFGHR